MRIIWVRRPALPFKAFFNRPDDRPDVGQRPAVRRLVVAGGDRQRHEDRREADRGELGDQLALPL